jgi:hypothetical protein
VAPFEWSQTESLFTNSLFFLSLLLDSVLRIFLLAISLGAFRSSVELPHGCMLVPLSRKLADSRSGNKAPQERAVSSSCRCPAAESCLMDVSRSAGGRLEAAAPPNCPVVERSAVPASDAASLLPKLILERDFCVVANFPSGSEGSQSAG